MKRIALVLAVVAAVFHGLPERAPARDPRLGGTQGSPILGTWLVEGRDLGGTSFAGVMELAAGTTGMV